ncbi:iron ABC transporter permease (plasmid) [Methylocystis sp. MJC1]|nr:iron ABC transporter permease [Methylocystis sp. MJC1]UZX14076.1 iron ABC transporter permease [Methylocystis sp. MJC1]
MLLLALAVGSLALGRYPLPVATVIEVLGRKLVPWNSQPPAIAETIVLQVRFPRVIAAVMVGAGLSVAGSAYQTIFRNPMASPALLGVSAGAGFGASLAMLLRQPLIIVEASAFVGGFIAVLIAYAAHRAIRGASIVTLVLCGMVTSALFQALISIVKYVADPVEILASITFWLMGGLSKIGVQEAIAVSIPVLAGSVILFALRWRLSLLSLGDAEAASLGVDVKKLRFTVIVCATIMSGATVCVAGIVGWVGLLVPHMARSVFGLKPGKLLMSTFLMGGLFVLGVDDLARSGFEAEIPLGVLTALIGAPFFLFLFIRFGQRNWQ